MKMSQEDATFIKKNRMGTVHEGHWINCLSWVGNGKKKSLLFFSKPEVE